MLAQGFRSFPVCQRERPLPSIVAAGFHPFYGPGRNGAYYQWTSPSQAGLPVHTAAGYFTLIHLLANPVPLMRGRDRVSGSITANGQS